MRVAIDARWIFEELSGIGRFTGELIRALAEGAAQDEFVLLFRNEALRDRTDAAVGFSQQPNFRAELLSCGVFSARSQAVLPARLRRLGIDVYHAPNYMIPLAAFPRGRPGRIRCVVTIHDVIPLLFPDHAPRSRKARFFPLFRWLIREAAARADVVTTVTEASRRDVIAQLGIPPDRADRVLAIHNGVAPGYAPASADRPAPHRSLLYVGRFDPYKNVPDLVAAFARLRAAGLNDLRLRLIGPPDPRYPEAQERARALGVHDAIDWQGYVSGGDLAQAYRDADVLILPSNYEGFGLPVVEAMASGTPVVCSTAAALREIAGEAALFAAPGDVDALAAAIRRALEDEPLRARLRAAGLDRARPFTWARCAEQMRAAYRLAAS